MQRKLPRKTRWLTLLGACVAVPHGKEMAHLASFCARARFMKFLDCRVPCPERDAKRYCAPRLAALLFDSLASLDPKPLEQFAAIVRQIRKYHTDDQPSFPFHSKAMRLAERMQSKRMPPVTRRKFLEMMGSLESKKDHEAASYSRRELARLPIVFAPDKRGRPKKGTRKGGM